MLLRFSTDFSQYKSTNSDKSSVKTTPTANTIGVVGALYEVLIMKKKSITILLLIILSGLLLSRCGNILEKTEDDSTIKQPSSKLASGDYFSLTDKTAHTYSYVLHKQATTSTECAIAKTVIGSADKDEEILWDNAQDMLCILDVEELDLFYHGVSFEINVP